MSCRIPGCITKYWDKNNKLQMFAADGKQTLMKWQEILKSKYGTENFGPNDRICVLHFAENALERTRKVYLKGGLCEEVDMKKPKLCAGALPTIFPSKIPRKKEKYYVEVDPEILDKQKKIFEKSRRDKEISLKRNLESDSTVLEEEVPAKRNKTNNLFSTIVNNIHDGIKLTQSLKKPWVQTLDANECVVWTLWKEDRSCIEKNIFLHPDLKVEVFIESKQIILPEMKDVVDMSDLEKLFKKVERIIPCKKLDVNVSLDVCLGFVVPSLNGKRVRCSPCCKLQRKSRRRSSTQSRAKEKCSIKRKTLKLQCKLLSSKARRLKVKIDTLKSNVKSLQKKCAEADSNAVNAAIEKLSFSEQTSVRCCFEAAKKKSLRGMRYTTQWVYECLLLRIKSKKAYDHIRKRRILVLPDPTTLHRYIKQIAGCYGFQSSIFSILSEKAKHMKSDETRGVLLVDEMKLAKSLAFNRRNLKVEGFTNLGQYTPENQKGKKGDHALVFMYQPFKGKWVQALGCFLSTGSASGTILHQLIIECIVLAERAGFRVDAVTTDGATWNRKMWKEFGVTKENVSVPHIIDDKRSLWFLSDFPHLIKCLRNFITQSGRDKNSGIWTPGGNVSLSHWYALLKIEDEKAFNLKANFKLKKDHLEPKYFQKMNVALAFQFFGVAETMVAFKHLNSDLYSCEPSIILCRKVKSLITAMNSRTPLNNLKPDNEMWQVITDFINYLDEWEEGAKKANCDFISDSTCYGLQVSLRATLQICQFLVEECGFSYLMTARLNQDSLERFFGLMRDCCGSNDHPDSNLFIQMYRLVCTYSLVKPPKGSNVSGGEILDVLISLKDMTDADGRWEQWIGQIDTIVDNGTRCDQLADSTELLEDHDYFKCTTSEYVLTYIAGFVARKANKFITFGGKTPCTECSRSLKLPPGEEIPETHKLIELKSYGYLIHPSHVLFHLISQLECATLKTIEKNDLNPDTLFEITKAMEELQNTPFVGCEEHKSKLTHRIITFFLTTRMLFLCKQANKNNTEKNHIREKRKLSKLPPDADTENKTNSKKAKENDSTEFQEISQNCKTNVKATLKPVRKRKKKNTDTSIKQVVQKGSCTDTQKPRKRNTKKSVLKENTLSVPTNSVAPKAQKRSNKKASLLEENVAKESKTAIKAAKTYSRKVLLNISNVQYVKM